MAVQRTDKSERSYDISVILSFLVTCAIIALAGGLCLSVFFKNPLWANSISFASTGIIAYGLMHFLFSDEMSRFDSRLLHELTKRKLIEIAPSDEDLVRSL